MDMEKLEKEKIILGELKLSALDLWEYRKEANRKGGVGSINRKDEHAIYDCINRIGDGVKRLRVLPYKD
jgi:hypothetical protein